MDGVRQPTKTLYPIRAAARLSQLSIDTLRAWEKRYAAVKPARRNGIRFYTDADVERLTLLKRAVNHGHSIGAIVRLSNADLEQIVAGASRRASASSSEGPIESILSAVDHFDFAAADRELARLASVMPPRELIHEVALPLLRIVGEQWHQQRLRISQEHLISQLLTSLLGSISRIYSPEHSPAVILTATLPGDLHEFGILAAAILSAGAGLRVFHLGASLPPREIAFAAKRSRANVVLLSVTSSPLQTPWESELRSLRESLPANIELWMGANPSTLEVKVKGVRVLHDFRAFERELQRIGGRL